MDIIASLPEDDVPIEILASTRQESDVGLLNHERDSYIPTDYETEGECRLQLSENC